MKCNKVFELFYDMINELKRWEIGYHIIDEIFSSTFHRSYRQVEYNPNFFRIGITSRHPRVIQDWLKQSPTNPYCYSHCGEIPIWLSQSQLTKGIIHQENRIASDESKWWFQATIGIPIFVRDPYLHNDWLENAFFFMDHTTPLADNIVMYGRLYRLLLLSLMVLRTSAHFDPGVLRRIDPLTLDVLLRGTRLPQKTLTSMLDDYLGRQVVTIEGVKVYLKYVESIPLYVRFSAVSHRPEILGLFL
jgi:hypothetical protein